MKFRLTEQIGYTYFPNDPDLYGYDLELNPDEIYDRLSEHFSKEKIVELLVYYGFANQEIKNELNIAEEDDIGWIIMEILQSINIYDLLGINEFRDIIEDYIDDAEAQLLLDVQDSEAFASSHAPEL